MFDKYNTIQKCFLALTIFIAAYCFYLYAFELKQMSMTLKAKYQSGHALNERQLEIVKAHYQHVKQFWLLALFGLASLACVDVFKSKKD